MSNASINTIDPSAKGITVTGTTHFEMTADNVTSFISYSIPDFTQTVSGKLILDDDTPTIELKKVPLSKAKILIDEFIKKHPGTRTSDLILRLELDPDLVVKALSILRKEGKIEGKKC
jgi:hypothetical protein